jgi:hypothetical protein
LIAIIKYIETRTIILFGYRGPCQKEMMIRALLVLLLAIAFFVSLGHFTYVKAQEMGILSVTTTPVSGDIYVDNTLRGTKFWSGNLSVGSHVISYGKVDGYIEPSTQTVTIIANQSNYIIGVYRKVFSSLFVLSLPPLVF